MFFRNHSLYFTRRGGLNPSEENPDITLFRFHPGPFLRPALFDNGRVSPPCLPMTLQRPFMLSPLLAWSVIGMPGGYSRKTQPSLYTSDVSWQGIRFPVFTGCGIQLYGGIGIYPPII